jgi:UDP-2-acetamido-3-amino-2,3-dideoxy-glucuronate N-acetyltransferase
MGSKISDSKLIDKTAIIHPTAKIGDRTRIWAYAQIGEHATIGRNCIIGNGAYIDRHVVIGDSVRIHNKALIYHGIVIEDKVFIGPGVCCTNDPHPKSGQTRSLEGKQWFIKKGASVGANATILPDVTIGENAVIGAGSVVTKDVPCNATVCGNPARLLEREQAH